MKEKAAVEEAVACRLSLLKTLSDPGPGAAMVMQFVNRHWTWAGYTDTEEAKAHSARNFFREEFLHTTTFVVPEEECDTIEQSWETYPAKEGGMTAFPSDILTPSGFVYFAKPLTDPVERNPLDALYALSWTVLKHEDSPFKMVSATDDSYVLFMLFYAKKDFLRANVRPRIWPIGSVAWELGVEGGGFITTDADTQFIGDIYRNAYMKVLLTFFAIIRQRMVEAGEPRQRTRSDLERVKDAQGKFPKLNKKVEVVRFRQSQGSAMKTGTGKSGWKLRNRKWVRPFWRWQWYKTLEENKPILIQPFLRGPKDAPIEGAERVFLPPKPLGDRPKH